MMTGAVSAAPVLNYTGEERLEEARQREEDRQERLCMPRVENIGSSLNEKEETQGAALEPVFRIDEIILSGQGEKFGRHKIIYGKDSALIPWKKRISHQRREYPEYLPSGAGAGTNETRQLL